MPARDIIITMNHRKSNGHKLLINKKTKIWCFVQCSDWRRAHKLIMNGRKYDFNLLFIIIINKFIVYSMKCSFDFRFCRPQMMWFGVSAICRDAYQPVTCVKRHDLHRAAVFQSWETPMPEIRCQNMDALKYCRKSMYPFVHSMALSNEFQLIHSFFFSFDLNSNGNNRRTNPQCDNAPRKYGKAFDDSLILCCYADMCNGHDQKRFHSNFIDGKLKWNFSYSYSWRIEWISMSVCAYGWASGERSKRQYWLNFWFRSILTTIDRPHYHFYWVDDRTNNATSHRRISIWFIRCLLIIMINLWILFIDRDFNTDDL